jgi:hypothetical protein
MVMVNKLVVFLGVLACSGAFISPVEAGKKKENDNNESHISVTKLKKTINKAQGKLPTKRKLIRGSTRVTHHSSEEITYSKTQEQFNPNTVENLKKAGKTRGLPKPKKIRVIKKSKEVPSPW